MRSLLRSLGGFIGLPALAALSGILVLPLLARAAGRDDWADISAAQVIGLFGAVMVTAGWAVWGPPHVAAMPSTIERKEALLDSTIIRLAAFMAVGAAVIVLTLVAIRPRDPLSAALMALAMASSGLSPSWYCIGLGRPRALAAADVLPRLGASVASAPILVVTGWIGWYPLLVLIAGICGAGAFTFLELRHSPWTAPDRRRLKGRLRSILPAAGVDAVGNAYGATPLPLAASSLDPTLAAGYASADRVYRLGLTLVVVTLGNAFQGWVLDPAVQDRRRRQGFALIAHLVVGALGLGFLALLGPWATAIVFGSTVAATGAVSALYGVAFLFISVSTPMIRNLLIPAGRVTTVMRATIASAVVGLSVMVLGAATDSAEAVALGVALSELVLVLSMAIPTRRAWRRLVDLEDQQPVMR